MKITAVPLAVVVSVVLAIVVGLAYFVWPRHHFDMVATLAEFVANEGPWDNEWDKPQEKIADVLKLIKTERDPVKAV